MHDSDDEWPMPNYSAGPKKHLHAVGVITTLYNSFESSVSVLFRHIWTYEKSRSLSQSFCFMNSMNKSAWKPFGWSLANARKTKAP